MNQLDEKTMTYLETRIPELAEGVRVAAPKKKIVLFLYKQYICLC